MRKYITTWSNEQQSNENSFDIQQKCLYMDYLSYLLHGSLSKYMLFKKYSTHNSYTRSKYD